MKLSIDNTSPINNNMAATIITPSLLQKPNRVVQSAWTGHIPFAFWIIETIKPAVFVELGAHSGTSYFAFCQSVTSNQLPTRCYAIDTWQGDEHAGFYDDAVYGAVKAYNETEYYAFSRLLKMSFDEALSHFNDHSIDILHIDGLHTYEAVKHDFSVWLPKLSESGVVLFHDINVREKDFGVWKFWEEISALYPHIAFDHSHGLGVLLVGIKQNSSIAEIAHEFNNPSDEHRIKSLFSRFGHMVEVEYTLTERDDFIKKLSFTITERDDHINNLNIHHQQELLKLHERNLELERIINNHVNTIQTMKSSGSWRLTKPMRQIRDIVRKFLDKSS